MTLPLSRLVRPGLLDIAPYVPGKPLESLQRAHGVHDIIRFASNENAFGASPRAIEAMRRAARSMVGSVGTGRRWRDRRPRARVSSTIRASHARLQPPGRRL